MNIIIIIIIDVVVVDVYYLYASVDSLFILFNSIRLGSTRHDTTTSRECECEC
jgi:hypothetical protein